MSEGFNLGLPTADPVGPGEPGYAALLRFFRSGLRVAQEGGVRLAVVRSAMNAALREAEREREDLAIAKKCTNEEKGIKSTHP